MLNPINSTMIAVALVPIATALEITAARAIWLVASLYLAAAISQPVMGTLADLFGPKRIYLAGLAVTGIAGFVPLVLPTFDGAMVARVLIGMGTSTAYPAAMTLIRDRSATLARETPPALLTALSAASLVTTAIGPVLGGILVLVFGWQAIFAVNLPLCAITFVLAAGWLPADADRPNRTNRLRLTKAVDFLGIGIFATAIASLLVLLLNLSPRLWWLGAVFVLSIGALVVWEWRRRDPFIDVRLLVSNAALSRTYLRLLLTFTMVYVFVNAASQWLQDPFGLSPLYAGLIQVPIALVAASASLAFARTTRLRLPLLITAIGPIGTGLVFAFIDTGSPLWLVLTGTLLIGIPQGLGSLANQAALYRQAPAQQIGKAAGLSRTSIYLGAIISSSIIGIAFGNAPSDQGMNTVGWTIIGLAICTFLLTIPDRRVLDTTP